MGSDAVIELKIEPQCSEKDLLDALAVILKAHGECRDNPESFRRMWIGCA